MQCPQQRVMNTTVENITEINVCVLLQYIIPIKAAPSVSADELLNFSCYFSKKLLFVLCINVG